MTTVLVVARALELLRQALGLPEAEDCNHPALRERLPALARVLNERVPGTDPLRRAEIFAGWLCVQQLPAVQEWLKTVAENVKRSGKYDIVPGVL